MRSTTPKTGRNRSTSEEFPGEPESALRGTHEEAHLPAADVQSFHDNGWLVVRYPFNRRYFVRGLMIGSLKG